MLTHLAQNAALPNEIDLWPAIRSHLSTDGAYTRAQEDEPRSKNQVSNRHRLIKISALIIIMFMGVVLTLPQGRALAQIILRFFTPAQSSTFVLPSQSANAVLTTSPTYITPALEGCEDNTTANTYRCMISSAEAALGFKVKEFPTDPEGFTFISASTEFSQNLIRLTYSRDGGELTLTEIHGTSIASPWEASWGSVPTDSIKKIQVNGYDGEYVRGIFVVKSQTGTKAEWEPDAPVQRLRWREGDMYFEIQMAGLPGDDDLIGKTWLISLAESLK